MSSRAREAIRWSEPKCWEYTEVRRAAVKLVAAGYGRRIANFVTPAAPLADLYCAAIRAGCEELMVAIYLLDPVGAPAAGKAAAAEATTLPDIRDRWLAQYTAGPRRDTL